MNRPTATAAHLVAIAALLVLTTGSAHCGSGCPEVFALGLRAGAVYPIVLQRPARAEHHRERLPPTSCGALDGITTGSTIALRTGTLRSETSCRLWGSLEEPALTVAPRTGYSSPFGAAVVPVIETVSFDDGCTGSWALALEALPADGGPAEAVVVRVFSHAPNAACAARIGSTAGSCGDAWLATLGEPR